MIAESLRVRGRLKAAIITAPGDLTDKKEITFTSNMTVQRMLQTDMKLPDLSGSLIRKTISKKHSLKEMYDFATGLLSGSEEDKNAFNRYLISTATQLTSNIMAESFPKPPKESKEEMLQRLTQHSNHFDAYMYLTVHQLLHTLIIDKTDNYKIREKVLDGLRQNTIKNTALQVSEALAKKLTDKPATVRTLEMLVESMFDRSEEINEAIGSIVDHAEADFKKTGGSAIRKMTDIVLETDKFCQKEKVENPLLDLTLGDVTGLGMDEVTAEALALNPIGPKGLAKAMLASSYMGMAYQAGAKFDLQRYEANSLGWSELRNEFVKYGQEFGLYSSDKNVVQSIIGAGGADAIYRASRIIRSHLEKKSPLPEGQKFEAYFSNPAFRMVGAKVRDAGFEVHEDVETKANDGFRPDLKKVAKYLDENKNCKVFVYVPINNPSSEITEPEYMNELIGILEERGVILINDMAYLGTGDIEANNKLAQSINSYENRVDVYSMSKIFGRTGLRCGCAVSTIKDLDFNKEFIPVARDIQLGNPYPMQAEAKAIWELVGAEDRKLLNIHYRGQQKRMMKLLREINKKRADRGEDPFFDLDNPDKPSFYNAALYVYVHLAKGINAFSVAKAGLVGTPGSGFYLQESKKAYIDDEYLRFALGSVLIPD